MKHKRISGVLTAAGILMSAICIQCAHPVSPAGGPKDETPPKPLMQVPPDRTTGFNANKITLVFDEYISLKDPAKEIFVSPPMKKKPVIKTKGKSVTVEFEEALQPDATYTISFGNAIVDFNESNALTNYEYVFSTGEHIDSLAVAGKVVNAFNHQPETEILVMLYRDNNDTLPIDSLPMHTPPVSASKSIKDGSFRINNLAPGEYLLFALQDLNNNFMFDLPNEKIAYLDSLIIVSPDEPIPPDSIETDTSGQITPPVMFGREYEYTLYLFEEVDSTQKLLGKRLTGNGLLTYFFRMPADSLSFTLLGIEPEPDDWYLPEYSANMDTINLWLKPGLPDTIRVRMAAGDSTADTSRFILSKAEPAKPAKQKEGKTGMLKITSNASGGAFDLNKPLMLTFSFPVETFDPEKIILTSETDTLSPPILFTDSIGRHCTVEYAWLEGQSYKITLDDSAFIDLYGHHNDSVTYFIKVRNLSDYGVLMMNVEIPQDGFQYIIQLLTEKEVVVRETIIEQSERLQFDYLLPGKYKLKAIRDQNLNGKWDTGNYRRRIPPEKVGYYAPGIVIRANWDLMEEWKPDLK